MTTNKFTLSPTFFFVLMTSIRMAVFSSKVSLDLQKTLETKDQVNVFITFNKGTEDVVAQINDRVFDNSGDKANAMYEALNALTSEIHQTVIKLLNSPEFLTPTYHSFWITNEVYVEGANGIMIETIANLSEVSSIYEEEDSMGLDDPIAIVEDTEPEEGDDK